MGSGFLRVKQTLAKVVMSKEEEEECGGSNKKEMPTSKQLQASTTFNTAQVPLNREGKVMVEVRKRKLAEPKLEQKNCGHMITIPSVKTMKTLSKKEFDKKIEVMIRKLKEGRNEYQKKRRKIQLLEVDDMVRIYVKPFGVFELDVDDDDLLSEIHMSRLTVVVVRFVVLDL
ncbi:hypothetical protein QVD17_18909 [Tagetes erecta]|uniref:Uncharacterized protein n=1 Tax=Tagetes erecta TaxID=13708 RepID=A0AAD8NWU5_TARER|nr:hypothetical protein QVD17_18909 [Tagetes erecta]